MTSEDRKHLWEIDHPYYCADSNYFSNDCTKEFESWEEFVKDEGDSDMDYNLLFRWDWQEGEDDNAPAYSGDDNERISDLRLYWMNQRKGLFRVSIIKVCRADEAAIIEWLRPRFEYLLGLWEPFKVKL